MLKSNWTLSFTKYNPYRTDGGTLFYLNSVFNLQSRTPSLVASLSNWSNYLYGLPFDCQYSNILLNICFLVILKCVLPRVNLFSFILFNTDCLAEDNFLLCKVFGVSSLIGPSIISPKCFSPAHSAIEFLFYCTTWKLNLLKTNTRLAFLQTDVVQSLTLLPACS